MVESLSVFQWPLEAVALVFVLTGVLYPLTQWATLPERIPCHFNFRGHPDRWGGRWVFVAFGLLQVILYGMFTFQGHTLDYLSATAEPISALLFLLLWTKMVLAGLFLYLVCTMIRVAKGQTTKASIPVLMLFTGFLVVPALILRVK